jgi:hypothetical protein
VKTYTESELKRHVSRMAAVLVHAAGGEIIVPLDDVRDAELFELEQIDRPGVAVIYRSRRTRFRRSGGDVVEGTVVRETGAAGAIIDTKALPAPGGDT